LLGKEFGVDADREANNLVRMHSLIKGYALEHLDDSGWRFIFEYWDEAQTTGYLRTRGVRTHGQALALAAEMARVYADHVAV
jgi:hypothetical protein